MDALAALRAAAFARREPVDVVAFWGHTPRAPGTLDASCLSQWWPAPFVVDGVRYVTAEHWMMAKKAEAFGDFAARAAILADASPQAAKAAGRAVRGYDGPTWEAARFDVVVRGNVHKFTQHAALCAFLRGTGDAVIVEASPVDAVWGVGLAADHEDVRRPARWRGQNLLGFALMVVRAGLPAMPV